jgi:hypothetical protein
VELTLAEEILLLGLDDEKGSSGIVVAHAALAGATLADLAEAGAVALEDGKVVPVVEGPPTHPVLARALAAVAGDPKHRDPRSWVPRLAQALKPVLATVAAPLVERGVLGEERRTFLGLPAGTRYPERDPLPERALRERLHRVLVEGAEPSGHDALLVGLLRTLNLVDASVAKEHRRAARARAKEVADQGVAGKAVQQAVQAQIMAAIMPAVVVAAVVV